jgi:hypothetical protein
MADTKLSALSSATAPLSTADLLYTSQSAVSKKVTVGTVFGGDLATEILADSPSGYWKLDEASGDFADSSGNSRTMTAVGSPSYRYGAWSPRETTKFVYFDATGDRASRSDICGFTAPITGDWTFESILVQPVLSATGNAIFAMAVGGETEATNTQINVGNDGTLGNLRSFSENGAGVDQTTTATIARLTGAEGVPTHLVFVKDGTANTITFYVNGILTDVMSYATEPTGGTGALISDLHGNGAGTGQLACGMAHAALFSTALSETRIRAHAKAAGFLNSY